MKKGMLKRFLVLLLSFSMIAAAFSGSVLAKETTDETPQETEETETTEPIRPGPRVATSVRIVPETTQVHGAATMKVTATWTDTGNLPLLATVTVTNGAKLTAEDEDDITFLSNNLSTQRPVTNLNVNADLNQMTFVTGINRMLQRSSIEFEIEAPLGNRHFEVTVFLGKEDGTSISNATNTATFSDINVISGLSVETRNAPDGEEIDDIDDYHAFYVTGMAWYKGTDAPDPSYILVVITNKETEEVVGEYEQIVDINNREYQFGPIVMPSKFDDGTYVVSAYMINDDPDDPRILGSSSKEVNFKKMPDIFEVAIYNQLKNIRASQSFIKSYDEPKILFEYISVNGSYNILSGWDVAASVQFKNASNVASSRFRVHTTYGVSEFAGSRSGNLVFANLRTFRTQPYISGSQRPYVECLVTYKDGSTELIYIGDLRIAVDPSGFITDADSGEPVVGATCTLYMKDPETDEWVLWDDPTEQQPNPCITGADGKYAWDVQDGSYDVRVYHPDYYDSEELFYSTLLDPRYGELVVPPEQTNINIQLSKQTGGIDEPEVRALTVSEPETEAINFIPAYQSEVEAGIESNSAVTIKVDADQKYFYLTKTQIQSMLDAGVDLVVEQGSNVINVETADLEAYASGVRTTVCLLIENL